MDTIKTLSSEPFRHFVSTIGNLPTSFTESMSYYELLAWLCNYLEKTVIPAVNNNAEALEELQKAFITLKEYVDNYFANLDIQTEIDNKLDEMAESGQLADIIAAYLQLQGVLAFNTVADITDATNLADGSFVKTYGYLRKGDGVYDIYKVRPVLTSDVIDGYDIVSITAAPTLIAERLPYGGELVIKMIATDNLADYLALNGKKTIILPKGIDYEFDDPLIINSDTTIDLNGSKLLYTGVSEIALFTYKTDDTFTGYTGNANIVLKNGKFYGGGISMLHNKDVVIENVEFETSTSRHTIQLAGCYNVVIKSCIFNGTIPANQHGSECIDIDACNYASQPFAPESSPMYDSTPNKNIVVSNNTFKEATNVDLRYTNAVGTHSHDSSGATTAEDVYITGNNFGNPSYSAINLADYINTVIENNTCESSQIFVIKRGWLKHIKIHNNVAELLTKYFFANSGPSLKIEDLAITSNSMKVTDGNAATDAVMQLVTVQGANITNNTIRFQNHCFYTCDKESWDGGTYDATYRAKDINIAHNTLMKTTIQDASFNNRIRNTDNVSYIGNKFVHLVGGLETNYSEFNIQETNTGLVVQDNMTDYPMNFLDDTKISSIGSGFRYNNACYILSTTANQTSRSGTLATPISNFSTLILTCGTAADMQTVEIRPYYGEDRLDNRTWKIPQVKSDGTFGYATFTV